VVMHVPLAPGVLFIPGLKHSPYLKVKVDEDPAKLDAIMTSLIGYRKQRGVDLPGGISVDTNCAYATPHDAMANLPVFKGLGMPCQHVCRGEAALGTCSHADAGHVSRQGAVHGGAALPRPCAHRVYPCTARGMEEGTV
jgi:hypothetical protein